MLPFPKTQEVVSAQGAAVGATVGIGRSFGGRSASVPKNIRTIGDIGTQCNKIYE